MDGSLQVAALHEFHCKAIVSKGIIGILPEHLPKDLETIRCHSFALSHFEPNLRLSGMGDSTVMKVESTYSPKGKLGQKYLATGKSISMRLWDEAGDSQ